MVPQLENAGLSFVGSDETGRRMEVCIILNDCENPFSTVVSIWFFNPEEYYVWNVLKIVELGGHPYFVGVQFHPEFKSRPGKPSPLFLGTVLASSSS